MITINIKPLSINKAYKGKKYRTKDYDLYEYQVKQMLPKVDKIPLPPYEIKLVFGHSSLSSDWDNCIKTTQDIIAKHYGFNDKLIKKGTVIVKKVAKGKEYFAFALKNICIIE